MSWRIALFVGVLLAVACVAVGFTLDTSEVTVSSVEEAQDAQWPSPFERPIEVGLSDLPAPRGSTGPGSPPTEQELLLETETDGDARLWYFAAGGAVGTNAIAAGAVNSGKLGNGSVSGEKIGPSAVTGPKIAGGTITAANIAPGQVVTGDGNFLAKTQVPPTAVDPVPVLTVPGVGELLATCTAGTPNVTTISFQNASGGAQVVAWGVLEPAPPAPPAPPATAVSQLTPLNMGQSTDGIEALVLGLTYQVSFVKAGNQEVLTATVSAAPSSLGCLVTASALTTG